MEKKRKIEDAPGSEEKQATRCAKQEGEIRKEKEEANLGGFNGLVAR